MRSRHRTVGIQALRDRLESDSGMVALWVAVLAPVLFALAALAVDIANWYVAGATAQKAADAGSLAGVTYMPQDLTTARAKATEVARSNGASGAGWTVLVEPGDRPGQLRVTVSSVVRNAFGAFVGNPTTTVVRSAMADYNGPAPMGSPCNTFGNEPTPGNGFVPSGTVRPVPGFADCRNNPQFWASIAGPNVYKTQGDQYNVRYCDGDESGCIGGTTNDEFKPEGYFLLIRVVDRLRTGPITIQLYDPAYVDTNSRCTSLPTFPVQNMNSFTTDAFSRYSPSPNDFCPGDNNNDGWRVGTAVPTVTSFGLRRPDPSQNPLNASPETQCPAQQYPGYTTPTVTSLQQYRTAGNAGSGANPNYNAALARVFHQWVSLCTFTPTENGDYYLQVRANVPLGSANAIFTQSGDNASVVSNGSNRFAVRVSSFDGTAVSVAGWQRMPIFANADSANATFPLIRVLPGAAGKSIKFTFYDVGDAANAGSVTINPPGDSNVTSLNGCTASGYWTSNLTNCTVPNISGPAGWNGQAETMQVPIPSTYTCSYNSPDGCWFKVNFNFPGGQVTDQTTWTASIQGDPVRLVQ